MDVLFLRNPDTGEVRRFFARPAVPHDIKSFFGWDVVDADAWMTANADMAVVEAAVARYHELTASAQPPAAETGARGDGVVDDSGYTRGYDAGLLDGYAGVDADWVKRFEARQAELEKQLAAAEAAKVAIAEIANDYRDQIWVHQGTLRVLKSWLHKEDGFSAEDGFTEASILGMVERDLEASEAMDTRTLQATGGEVAE